MTRTEAAATQSKKRKCVLDVHGVDKLFDTKPEDYKVAWNEIKDRILKPHNDAQQTAPSVSLT